MFKMQHPTTRPRPVEGTDMATCTVMEHTGLSSLPTEPSSMPEMWHGGGKDPLGGWKEPIDFPLDTGDGHLVQTIADGSGGQDVQGLLEFGVFGGQTGGYLRFGMS